MGILLTKHKLGLDGEASYLKVLKIVKFSGAISKSSSSSLT